MSNGVVRSWSQGVEGFTVRAYVGLTPPETRDLRSTAVTEKLKELMGEVPDAERMSFSLSGNDSGPAIQIALLAEDQDALRAASEELKARLIRFSEITSVRDSEEAAIEELQISLKPGAELLGVNLADVSRQIRQAYFGEEVQRLPREGDFVRVYVRYPVADRESLDSLRKFRIRTSDGRELPFEKIATAEFAPGVTGLDRRQRQRTITVEAELPQEERAKVMKTLTDEKFFEELEAKYPAVKRRSIGQEEGQNEFLAELGRLFAFALLAMYFLLAVTFRSYNQPLLIMSAIPFAFVGAVAGHFMFDTSFALFSWLGMIAAMGVIVNDNVVLVDKTNQFREEGMDAYTAVTEAGVSRFRQIFLTSVTEFVGLAPMLFEMAAIAQFLKPMALSLAFGVLLAMPATLILTPVLYMIGKDIKSGAGAVWRGAKWTVGLRPKPSMAE
jgi:multidrug efflux pump subunit AcrB